MTPLAPGQTREWQGWSVVPTIFVTLRWVGKARKGRRKMESLILNVEDNLYYKSGDVVVFSEDALWHSQSKLIA